MHGWCACDFNLHENLGRFDYGKMKGGLAITVFGGEEKAC
jgi:hypothetical protein